jgi:hypothetical protein
MLTGAQFLRDSILLSLRIYREGLKEARKCVIQDMLDLPNRTPECYCCPSHPNQTPWPESGSELYQSSYRRLSAKLVPTFAHRRVSRSQRGGSPTAVLPAF